MCCDTQGSSFNPQHGEGENQTLKSVWHYFLLTQEGISTLSPFLKYLSGLLKHWSSYLLQHPTKETTTTFILPSNQQAGSVVAKMTSSGARMSSNSCSLGFILPSVNLPLQYSHENQLCFEDMNTQCHLTIIFYNHYYLLHYTLLEI